jgi:uncharacterized protein (DUF1697 family)
MLTHVALLRGINVSGQKKIKMADLRKLLEQIDLREVQTYIQSGNIVFQSSLEAAALRQKISGVIADYYGFEVPVQVIPANQWREWANENPFLPGHEEDLRFLHLTILEKDPGPLPPLSFDTEDQFEQRGRLIYLYCPGGYGRSKLANTFWERKAGCAATTRNWKTVRKLAEMVGMGT